MEEEVWEVVVVVELAGLVLGMVLVLVFEVDLDDDG